MPYLLEKKIISDFATTICLRVAVAVAVTRHSRWTTQKYSLSCQGKSRKLIWYAYLFAQLFPFISYCGDGNL